MGTARDRLNQIRGKSENITARDRLNQLRERPKQREKIGFDTLSKDMASVGKTVNSVYGGWQDPTTMASGKKEVQGIYDRLSALQDYQNKYGVDVPGRIAVKPGTTMEDVGVTSPFGFKNYANASPRLVTDVANKEFAKNYTKQQKANTYQAKSAYKSILDNWDERAERYSLYPSADVYNKEMDTLNELYGMPLEEIEKRRSEASKLKIVHDEAIVLQNEVKKYMNAGFSNGAGNLAKEKEARNNLQAYLKQNGYNSMSELENDLKGVLYTTVDGQNITLDSLYNEKKYQVDYDDNYKVLLSNPNFKEKSKYVKKNVTYDPVGYGASVTYPSDYDAYIYNLVNGDSDASNHFLNENYAQNGTADTDKYKYLNDEEKLIFNYLYATQGPRKANDFLDFLDDNLQTRRNIVDAQRYAQDAAEHPVISSAFEVLSSPFTNFISGAAILGDKLDDGTIDENSALYSGRLRKNITYSTVEDSIDSDVGKFFYRHGTNIGENVAALGVGGFGMLGGVSGAITQTVMSLGSFSDTALSAKERGLSDDQAFTLGVVAGATEWVFESKGFEALFDKETLGESAWKYFVNNLKTEIVGELGTELTNDVADILISKDMSEWQTEINSYISQGMTKNEAVTKAIGNAALRYGEVALGTLFSSGVMAGPPAALGGISNYNANKSTGASIRANDRIGDVFDVVQNMTPEESSAYEAYTRYANKGITADNITDAKLGNLHRMATMDSVKASLSETSTDKQRAEAENRLYRLGKAMEKNNASEKKRNAEATTEQGTSNAEKYTVDNTTQITSTGKSVKIEGIKVDGDKINVVTNDGEISADDMTFTSSDRAILGNAEQIAREYSNDLANVFISQYDGKTDTEAYANAFNLMTEYTKNNVTESVMLENRGPLTTEQVKAIYNAAVHQQFVAQENAIKTYTEKQGKNNVVKGTFDDSIIDYNGTTTDGSKVNWNSLEPRQKSAIKFARMFSKATGVNIRFIQSKVEGGKRVGENGSYDPDTNTIEIDVYAGIVNAKSINDSIIPTLSHEITHWMKNKAPALYDTFRNEIMNSLVASRITKDVAVRKTSEDLIEDELARLRKKHPNEEWTEEDAIDEIVARACEDMLRNSDAARKLIGKLKPAEQKKIIAKLKEIVKNLLEWVNNLLKEYASSSYEARLLGEYKENLKKLSKMWDEMLVNAVKNNQALQNEGVIGETLVNGISKDGTTIEGKNTLQMSDRTYREGGREFLINWLDGHRGLTEADKQDIIDQTDRIAELMRAIENEEELPDYSNWANMEVVKDENGEKVLSVIVKNGDYAMNIDFSQVCKKRVALNAVLNAMVQSGDLNVYTLTETDVADLNAIIKEHDFEIACALCFVDSKRYRVGAWAESFCEGAEKKKNGKMVHQYGFNEMVRSLVPKGSNIKIDEYNFTGRDIENQPTKNLLSEADDSELDFTLIDEIMKRESKPDGKSTDLYAYAKAIKDNKSLRKILNPAEIISSIGLDAIRLEEPELYRLINRHQGTARPKFSHDIVAYGNDILKAKGFSAEKAKMVGGVRCQSFSDFMANMVIDYAQFVSELSAKELTCHTYTKEPLFVKLFGLTGIKINMSLVPKAIDMTPEQQKQFAILKDKNANKRSAEYKEAMKQYEKLAKNAGLDENGNYIWEDETFPYDVAMELVADPRYSANCGTIAVGISDNHIRKLLADPMISMVIPYHKSGLNHDVAMMRDIALYKDYTKVQSTRYSNGQKLKGAPDFDFYGDLYGVDGKEGTHDPKKTAENYLAWCREHNYLPKFNAFASDPNYYKLLVDFRVYDTDGTYREQQPVKPIYPSNEEFKDLILNGVTDKNGKVYGGLKQQQGSSDRLSAESQQIIDEYREVLKDKYGKDVLKKQYSERDYSYDELVSKPDMIVTMLDQTIPQSRKEIIDEAKKNVITVGKRNNDGSTSVYVDDIGNDVIVSKDTVRHSLDRRINVNGPVVLKIGEILKNSIKVNEMMPREDNIEKSYILLGTAKDSNDNYYYATFVVNSYSNTIASVDVVYSANAKKESAGINSPRLSTASTDSVISIAELLEKVNTYFPDILPEDVLRHFGHTERPEGILGESVLYSDRQESIPTEELYDLMGENEKLKKRVQILTDDIERWKERLKMEGKVTNGQYFRTSTLEKLAGHLRKMYNSKIDKARLTDLLRELTQVIHSLDTSGMTADRMLNEHLLPVAYAIAEEMTINPTIDDEANSILKAIRDEKIIVSEGMINELQSIYDTHWNRAFFGKINVSKGDKSNIDEVYARLQADYPSVFPDAVSDGDMLPNILDAYNRLKDAMYIEQNFNVHESAMDIAREIYVQAWNLAPTRTVADKYSEKIKALKTEHNRSMSELKQTYEDRAEKQKLADDMYYGRRMQEISREKDVEKDEAVERQSLLDDMYYNRRMHIRHKNDVAAKRKAVSKARIEATDKQKLLDDMYYGRELLEMRKNKKDAVAKQKQADNERYSKIIDNIRKRDEMALDLAKKKGKEKLDKYKENALRKTRLQRITANVLDLSRKLLKNSKDEHIPEIMKPIIVELVQALDFSSKRMLDKGIPTQKDISLYKALEQVKQMMLDATRGVEGMHDFAGHGLDDKIEALVSAAFNTMRAFGDNEFVLTNLSLESLTTLDEVVRFIKYVVNTVNKFYVAKHSQGVANLSKESVSEMRELGDGKKFISKKNPKKKSGVGYVVELLNWKNINPYYAFKRFGEGGRKIFEALQDGWDKFAFNVNQILEFAKNAYTDNEVKEWSEKVETFEITEPVTEEEKADPDYKPKKIKVRMTVAQIMSLYCLNKREQARGHLLGGGMRVADFVDGKKAVSQTDAVILTDKTIAEIIGRLDKRQIEVADKLQKFLSEDCAKWGNEVSMLRFGYNAFGELNYFPIQSDENNVEVNDATDNQNSLFRLLNMSFSKSLTDNANNAIVISNIFDVFAQHSSDMAKYNALALPVLDAFRWYNYVEKQQKGEIEGNTPHKTMSVKEAMEKAFGNDAKEYFTTFLRDINGTQNVSRDTLGNFFFKNAKIASVGLNLRVVLLQPTSYFRASAVIDGKYLSRALMHKPKMADAIKHCGIALWKSLGYYDTNVQRSVEEQIKHSQTKKDKAIELSMKGAEFADKLTWGYLWNACELEIRDKRKDLKVGSEEFFEAVGKRLRDVIYATQVVDSTMTRSEMMRSSDWKDKMLTAFASEPTLAYNMLYDAYMDYHLDARKYGKAEAVKKNGRKIARVIMAYTVTNMVAALVESGFDAFRDDEEDKDLVYFMKLYFTNFASDMSITGKIPYIKEIHSALKGFSSSRTDTQWMETAARLVKEVGKATYGEGNSSKIAKNFIKLLTDISGLPFYNVYRDLNAGINLLTDEDLDEMFNDFFD